MNKTLARQLSNQAPLFAALGDKTRLLLLVKLGGGEPYSVTTLAEKSSLTRQAIRKHLHVLEEVGMVKGVKCGRENLFQFNPKPIRELKLSLEDISRHWDDALTRLKRFAEE
ncbi:ArsR/SmtB family transcription factor [Aureliella helgolandensis]|uniref:Helix-turn-helix domain protein n=1 Tax=Aureliella helgolandensis TaxID=2527968 RepID=A0A518G491_9BACT|nr:helix-turn-helix transcriptional regulator [Aureliella helgolandensis]QDV23412.1 Helix-turn-helix domain protein [Aureliella helgolandensis]